MDKPDIITVPAGAAAAAPLEVAHPSARRGPLGLPARLALAVAFALPLYEITRFAFGSGLYSYIVLIPVISGYLGWMQRHAVRAESAARPSWAAAVLFLAGIILAAALVMPHAWLAAQNRVALLALGLVALATGAVAWVLGAAAVKTLAFPLAFLLFAAPLPTAVQQISEWLMQHGSAAVAEALFEAAGTPFRYADLTFQLPGISLRVAPECSGLRSTLVLFIVSVAAAHFLVRRSATRAALALAVIPLAFLRNGFRIFVIGELCVRVGPHMIDSVVHHYGGPLFFALSLPLLFLVLALLRRIENRFDR